MSTKYVTSTVALAAVAALAIGLPAAAQTMVGGQEISDENLDMVREHCQMLANRSDTDASSDTADVRAPGESESGGDMYAEAVDSDTEAVNSSPQDGAEGNTSGEASQSSSIDLDAITAEDCEAAGLAPS